MAFIYAYFFSDFLRFDMSLLLLTVTLRGVSNKHCLLSLFFILNIFSETPWPIKDKFHVKKVYINGLGHMTKMAAMPIYVKNL